MKMRSSFDDLDISVMVVAPDDEPKAVLQISHGMCGCKERYQAFMKYMAERGIACVAGDHRGHGGSVKSPDDLGYMYKGGYLALVDDLRMITDWVRAEYPGKPVYLLGHSMGSMAARIYAKYDDSEIDGLIICGSPSWNPMAWLGLFLGNLLCSCGLSHVHLSASQKLASNRYNRRFASEGYQAWTCSDPEVRKSMSENPLCNFALTANGSRNVMGMMVDTYRPDKWAVTNPHLPVFFISGEDDPVMVSEKKFHAAARDICSRGYDNVTSAIYPSMRHEVLNEIGKEQVWDEILDFINLN